MTGRRDPLHDALLDLESSAPFESPPPMRAGPLRRLLWLGAGAVAAATVLVGVVVGSAMLDRDDTGQDSATPSPTSMPSVASSRSPSPSPSPSLSPTSSPAMTPTPTEAPEASGWRVIPFESSDRESTGGINFDDQLGLWMIVALHRNFPDEGTTPIPVLTSANGTDWTVTGSIPLDGVDAAGFIRIGRIVRFADELYISATHTDDSNVTTPLAWTSADGAVWRPSLTEMPTGEYGTAEVIASSNGRLLAEVGERDGGHVWVSTDGRTWTEADVPSQGFPMGVNAAHADADGFVLAGHVLEGANTWVPAIWASPDGIAWTRGSSLPEGGGHAWGVARGPDGSYVATIDLEDAPTQLISSPDALTWSTMLEIGAANEHPAGLDGSPSGAVYIGVHGGAVRVLTWTDSGGTWNELTAPPDSSTDYGYSNLTVGAEGWVAAGTQGGSDEPGAELRPPILLVGRLAD